jgi:hypothetical protein
MLLRRQLNVYVSARLTTDLPCDISIFHQLFEYQLFGINGSAIPDDIQNHLE